MKTILLLLGMLLVSGAEGRAPAKVPTVGVLQNRSVATVGHLTLALVRGLAELGYAEGKNVVFEVATPTGSSTACLRSRGSSRI